MFQVEVAEEIKTHFMLRKDFSENRTIYEIMSTNVVEPESPQVAI
jgi:hypothetical protein